MILAGITINSIFGSDSVLNKATQEKEEDSHGTVKDQINLEEAAKNGLLQVGDYVAYTPDTIGAGGTENLNDGEITLNKLSSKTYTARIANTGYEKDQTIEQEKLNWRIFSIDNSTGEVLLVSETPTRRALVLKGSVGWLNAEKELNNACRELYSSSKLGEARHLTMEDINKAVGYDPKTQVEGYNEEKSTDVAIYYPDENGDMTYDYDGYTLKKLKQGIYTRPQEMTPYGYYLSDEAEETFKTMIMGDSNNENWYYETSDGRRNSSKIYTHWLASRSVRVYSDSADFYVGCLHNYSGDGYVSSRGFGNYDYYLFYGIDGYADVNHDFGPLRPIVTLNSKVQINTDDGQEEHNTQETAWEIY